jgi:glucosyl-3-phosphoglycerate phosphatase
MFLIRHGQTEFNRVFSVTRRDPGIRDPKLTEIGRLQASAVAVALRAVNPRLLISSPYARALETAEIIAGHLELPITVEALVAERCAFICDIGSPLATLRARWPNIAFDHLRDPCGRRRRKVRTCYSSDPRRFGAAWRRTSGPGSRWSRIGALSAP